MANPRDVNIDIVGHDHTDRATRSAARNLNQLKRKMDDNAKSSEKLSKRMAAMAKTVGKAGAFAASFASLLGPAVIGISKLAVGSAHLAVTMSPLLATLPAVAAGLGLIGLTWKLAFGKKGEALKAAVDPVRKAFEKLQPTIQKIAFAGLPALSRGFVKVNFPTIAKGMERIAGAMNVVVRRVGAWVNSTAGQSAIRTITEATAKATERLAPHIAAVVVSFGNLVNRAGDPAIRGLGGLLERIADATKRWLDGISKADIKKALDDAKSAAGAFKDKLSAVKDVLVWIGNNPGKIRAISDALAGVGIALGAATGNWVAIVAGAVTLMLNHLGTLKTAAPDIFKTLKTDPAAKAWMDTLQGYTTSFVAGFTATWDKVGDTVKGNLAAIDASVAQTGSNMKGWAPAFEKLGQLIGYVGAAMSIFALATSEAVRGVSEALASLQTPARILYHVMTAAFGGIGGALRQIGTAAVVAYHVMASAFGGIRGALGQIGTAFVVAGHVMASAFGGVIGAIRQIAAAIHAAVSAVAGGVGRIKSLIGSIPSLPKIQIPFLGAAGQSFAFAAPGGGGRTQPARPVASPVTVENRVMLDGAPFYAMTSTAVRSGLDRQAFRARVGRR